MTVGKIIYLINLIHEVLVWDNKKFDPYQWKRTQLWALISPIDDQAFVSPVNDISPFLD